MKVAMRRTVLVAVICFAVALVVSVVFLAWFNADPDTNITAILASLPLSYLYAVSSGLAAFSAGALVALVVGALAHLRMPNLPRMVFAALGWVMLGFLLIAPIIATLASSSAAIVFALVVYAAIKVPVVFAAFGLLLGLGFAERRDAQQ
jgi:MFS family permease